MNRLSCVDERGGSPSVEAAVLVVVVAAVIAMVTALGRLTAAESAVDQAARAAARLASIARDVDAASAGARGEAERVLAAQGIDCAQLAVDVALAGGSTPQGADVVRARITCTVRWSDLGLPVAPGDRPVTAEFISPVDRLRERP